jgi:hypothetical protein
MTQLHSYTAYRADKCSSIISLSHCSTTNKDLGADYATVMPPDTAHALQHKVGLLTGLVLDWLVQDCAANITPLELADAGGDVVRL